MSPRRRMGKHYLKKQNKLSCLLKNLANVFIVSNGVTTSLWLHMIMLSWSKILKIAVEVFIIRVHKNWRFHVAVLHWTANKCTMHMHILHFSLLLPSRFSLRFRRWNVVLPSFYRFFMFYSFINLFNLLVIVVISTIITNTVQIFYSPLLKVI